MNMMITLTQIKLINQDDENKLLFDSYISYSLMDLINLNVYFIKIC